MIRAVERAQLSSSTISASALPVNLSQNCQQSQKNNESINILDAKLNEISDCIQANIKQTSTIFAQSKASEDAIEASFKLFEAKLNDRRKSLILALNEQSTKQLQILSTQKQQLSKQEQTLKELQNDPKINESQLTEAISNVSRFPSGTLDNLHQNLISFVIDSDAVCEFIANIGTFEGNQVTKIQKQGVDLVISVEDISYTFGRAVLSMSGNSKINDDGIQYAIRYKKANNVIHDDEKADDIKWKESVLDVGCNKYQMSELRMKTKYKICARFKHNESEWNEYSKPFCFETLQNPNIDILEVLHRSECPQSEYAIPFIFKSRNVSEYATFVGCESYELIGKKDEKQKMRLHFPYIYTKLNECDEQWCRVYGGKYSNFAGLKAGTLIANALGLQYVKLCNDGTGRYLRKYPEDARNLMVQISIDTKTDVPVISGQKSKGVHSLPWVELKSSLVHIHIQ